MTLQARFSGPYTVERKLSDTNRIICTPDCKCKSRVCHLNMLKAYVVRNVTKDTSLVKPVSVSTIVLPIVYCPEAEGLVAKMLKLHVLACRILIFWVI